MKISREFRRLTFSRKLEAKQLQVILRNTMEEVESNIASGVGLARLESVLITPKETTVCISGNRAGLDAIGKAVRGQIAGTKVAKARQADAKRPPRRIG